MDGRILFLVVLGLYLIVANGKIELPENWWNNPPLFVFIAIVLVTNLITHGPKIIKRIQKK